MTPRAPMIYATRIRHARSAPVRNAFTYRSHSWLVDLDDLPRLPRLLRGLASFHAEDHVGRPDRSIRENVDAFLASHDIHLGDGRVLMLANARVLGHVFNPISVHWCYDAGRLDCVVVEVHNTYGDRHAYLVHPDTSGRAQVEKALYVSPFNDVDGHYEVTAPEPGDRVHLSVTLHRDGQPPFVVTLRGAGAPATVRRILLTSLRQPVEPLRVAARIRWQGFLLWAQGLPVRPRPDHPPQRGLQ